MKELVRKAKKRKTITAYNCCACTPLCSDCNGIFSYIIQSQVYMQNFNTQGAAPGVK